MSVKNLLVNQNIVSKQSQEHRPETRDNDEVVRDSNTTSLHTELSWLISQHVERAYNVVILNLVIAVLSPCNQSKLNCWVLLQKDNLWKIYLDIKILL